MNNLLKNMTITQKLTIGICLLLTILTLCLGTMSSIKAYNAINDQVKTNAPQIAISGANLVRSILDKHIEVIGTIASISDIKFIKNLILKTNSFNQEFIQLGVATPDGNITLNNGDTANVSERDYFIKAIAGETFVSDVFIHKLLKKPVMVFSQPVKNSQSQIIGIVIGVEDATWLTEATASIKYGDKGYSYIIDGKGAMVAHSNQDYVLNQTNFIEEAKTKPEYLRLAEMFKKMVNGETGFDRYDFMGTERIFGYTKITGTSWSIAAGANVKDVFKHVDAMITNIVLISLLYLAIGLILSIIFTRSIVRPLNYTVKMLGEFLDKEITDLTKRFQIKNNDEIGKMALILNKTFDKVTALVLSIKKQTGVLSDIGENLAANMTETASSINEISSNIQSVKNQAINQSAGVTEANATMENITKSIKILNEQIEQQSVNVTQSSSAIEEMLANINSVTSTLIKNESNIKSLTSASESGKIDLTAVADDIQNVAKESEGLLEISTVIQNIASQTNLLSMNAAIEAAHAGESGKGFAVVADEIRKLAESSSEQAKTVSNVLKKIKDSVDQMTRSIKQVLLKFDSIESEIKTVYNQESAIRNAMEEQTIGNKQVLEAISHLNDITQKVKLSSNEILTGSNEVIKESQNLYQITEEITNSMNEMASGAQQIVVAVNTVNDITNENKNSINTLIEEVDKFRVN